LRLLCLQVSQHVRGQLLVPSAMFDTLSSSLSNAFKSLNADAKLTAENMKVRQRCHFQQFCNTWLSVWLVVCLPGRLAGR
jgi:hypothetical protein